MNTVTQQTRRESFLKVDLTKRELEVLEILQDGIERTAREVSEEMCERGFTNTVERNNASPRLTSLLEQRKVMIVGKTLDHITGKKVSVFKIVKEN